MKITNLITGVLLLFVFTNSCSYSSKATKRLLNNVTVPYDLIIVPGVPLEKDGWSRTMKGRIYWSKYLYDRGIAKNIMYSGSAVYTPYYEGIVMALYAEAIGIPKEYIYVETAAEHSTENIYYSYHKAIELGFTHIAVASDPFQTKILKRFVKTRVSPKIGFLPMVTDTLKVMEPAMLDPVIEYGKAYRKDFISIKDRERFLKRFKGTLGLKFPRI